MLKNKHPQFTICDIFEIFIEFCTRFIPQVSAKEDRFLMKSIGNALNKHLLCTRSENDQPLQYAPAHHKQIVYPVAIPSVETD